MKWEQRKFKKNYDGKYKYSSWHEWFAWYPVKISGTEKVWLEKIIRKTKYNHPYSIVDVIFHLDTRFEYKHSIVDLIRDEPKNECSSVGTECEDDE